MKRHSKFLSVKMPEIKQVICSLLEMALKSNLSQFSDELKDQERDYLGVKEDLVAVSISNPDCEVKGVNGY